MILLLTLDDRGASMISTSFRSGSEDSRGFFSVEVPGEVPTIESKEEEIMSNKHP